MDAVHESDGWGGARVSRRKVLQGAGAGVGLALVGTGPARATPATLAKHHAADVLHGWVAALYRSQGQAWAWPTMAARFYGLAMLAGWEAVVDGVPNRRSLGGRLNGLGTSPVAGAKKVHWPIAANAAIGHVAAATAVGVPGPGGLDRTPAVREGLVSHRQSTHAALSRGVAASTVNAAVRHGEAVGRWLVTWAAADGFDQRDAGATYVPPVGPGLWVTTHPNFGAAIEPNWHRVRPFALQVTRDANGRAVCPAAPTPPIPYDPTPGSAFHREAMVVVDAQANLTDAQRMTAMYWRDNPDGVTGLPAGHWIGIASAAAEDSGKDLGEAAEVLALTAICIADAFTSCWIEKYRTNLLRPISYIRDHINPGWTTFVNTPAFPEYTSGHSVGSAAAAHALTALLGNRSFVDRHSEGRRVTGNPSGTTYTLTARRFASFTAAADEAASSRLWGGIHYPMGISHGLTQGRRVAELVMATARTTPGNGPR